MSGVSHASAVGPAVRKHAHLVGGVTKLTPFDEMMAREESEFTSDEQAIRHEAISTMLGWFWEGGLDLERASKRLVTYTRNYRPELVLNISCETAAAMFGQGRAAESARTEVLEKTMRRAGYRHTTLPTRKSDRARAKMAKAQKGNKHRARSVKKKKA